MPNAFRLLIRRVPLLVSLLAVSILLTACEHSITVRANPTSIQAGQSTTITATLKVGKNPVPTGVTVKFWVSTTEGLACGNFGGQTSVNATTNASGVATVTLTGSAAVDDAACTVTVHADASASGETFKGTTVVTVTPPPQ